MSRRRRAEKRETLPDARYGDPVLGKFMNCLMWEGKKSVAERMVYEALDQIENKIRQPGLTVFHEALKNIRPSLEVRSRRVGGSTYQVPVEVHSHRARALAIRWLIKSARRRGEHTMTERLSAELLDAANHRGASVKKREDTHRLAESNRAFSHYRW